MPQTIVITLTIAGTDTGPFDLYECTSAVTCSACPFQTNVSKASLQAGYTATVADATTFIKVKSKGTCTTELILPVTGTPPTTSTTSSTTSTTTTIEFVEMIFYGRHKPGSVAPPAMKFLYSLDSGATWTQVGSFSDTNCDYRGGTSVPKNSSMLVKVVTDDMAETNWKSTRTVALGPSTCPAFNPGDGVCIWPISTNSDKWLYFTVWNEDTGAC
jgi:hypothetical protein